ncbi:hypothetical protein A3K81_00855 [Candidatus Bathyarchaeota archaeon RBG_13_60_20]|nr:MAG: hypothetical protein A3K81_00855 [Candidatus Bathyarchaeota archaeon RBG_13_60_20]
MEDCDALDFLWLEGRYLGFIVETHAELNLLEHIGECGRCRARVLKAVEGDEKILVLGTLFQRGSAEEGVPVYDGDAETFMDARVGWRRAKLESLLREAEAGLESLRERL